ncbi:unnamed protein product [Rhodiola kirilowii]
MQQHSDTLIKFKLPPQDNYLVELMQAATRTLDGIIDTIPVVHPIAPVLNLLKTNGKLVVVGAPTEPLDLYLFPMIMGRTLVAGSCTGGIKETMRCLILQLKRK